MEIIFMNVLHISISMQLAKIDRYESRLTSMAYMGNFDELLSSAQPVSTKLYESLTLVQLCSMLHKEHHNFYACYIVCLTVEGYAYYN